MADPFEPVWASDPAAIVEVPSAAQIAIGFQCGPANMGWFNWLFQRIMNVINDLGDDSVVPASRVVATNGGIGGGGDLSVDRTHALDYTSLELVDAIANEDEIAIRIAATGAHKRITREDLVAGLGGGTGGGGGITGATNLGATGIGPYKTIAGSTLQFRKIDGQAGVAVALSGDVIVLSLADMAAELTYN